MGLARCYKTTVILTLIFAVFSTEFILQYVFYCGNLFTVV